MVQVYWGKIICVIFFYLDFVFSTYFFTIYEVGFLLLGLKGVLFFKTHLLRGSDSTFFKESLMRRKRRLRVVVGLIARLIIIMILIPLLKGLGNKNNDSNSGL